MANFFATRPPIDLGATTITIHQAITIGVAIVVAIVLRIVLTRPRIGIAMRAAVDDRPLASLNGARPDRVSMLSWAIGTSLAALGGILIAPGIALDAASLSLLIVSAYAAAIFGRLRSLPLTFLGAVVVGCSEGYLSGYLPQNQYLSGLRLAIPAIILFIVLLALPNPRLRGRMTRSREFFPTPTIKGALGFAGAVDRDRCRRRHHRERPGPHHLRARVLPRDRRALPGPARRLRGADLAVPAQLRGHRRGRHGPHGRRGRSARPGVGRTDLGGRRWTRSRSPPCASPASTSRSVRPRSR